MDPELAERKLVQRAAGGDEQALEELLLAYYDRLERRIERKLPASVRRTVTAEDILQQTLIAACRELRGFEYRGRWSVYRWLCRIAEFRLGDALKAHRAAKRGGDKVAADIWVDSRDQLIDLLAGPRRTPSRSVAGHEAAAAVTAALDRIREDYRQALTLRYVQGMTPGQVGQRMGRSAHAVHNLCHRGLKELEAVLGRASAYLTRH